MRSSKNPYTFLCKGYCKVYGCLPSELDNDSIGVFLVNDVHDILQCQGFEVEFVWDVVISTDGFRVVVYDYGFNSLIFKGHCCMNTAVIKFYTLPNSYRSRTNYNNFFIIRNSYFILIFIGTVIVRCFCFKLCSTCINHFVGCNYTIFFPDVSKVFLRASSVLGDLTIRESHSLSFFKDFWI